MYNNNSRDSSNLKGYSPLQFSCNLTGMKPAIGHYSYTHLTPNCVKRVKYNFENENIKKTRI